MNNFKKVLIANRGEIAVRIIRALKAMGISTVSVYSTADADTLHTRLADETICIGPPTSLNSYLDTYKILSAAEMTKADAIHPGIGFLAENAEFAELCKEAGIRFIGPEPQIIQAMGNKFEAKGIAKSCKIPVIKGSGQIISSLKECKEAINSIGYPTLLKAANGGGGKGIKVVHAPSDLEEMYHLCVQESNAAFGNSDIIIEHFLSDTRHVEVQIIGDNCGNVIHLGERECTIQRSKQKMIEEAGCVNINQSVKEKLYKDAISLAKHMKYAGPGTVEFLVLPDNSYYFLEMNTRLQVEHTITELITSIDIVKEQIKSMKGEALSYTQEDIQFKGYALECRITAEDVNGSFLPSFGKITGWHMPNGLGVRVETGYKLNDTVSPYYDSLLAKICCHADTKEDAVKKMLVCLEETKISGVKTNIDFLHFILNDKKFLNGTYNEKYVEEILPLYHVKGSG